MSIRVSFLSPSAGLGGAERSLLMLIEALRRHVWTVDPRVIVLEDGPLVDRLRALHTPVDVLPLPSFWAELGESYPGGDGRALQAAAAAVRAPSLLSYLARLRRVLRTQRPTIVHSNGIKAHLLGAVCRPADARLIWHVHDFLGQRRLSRRLLPLLSRRAHLAIANSREVQTEAGALLPRLPGVTIYNAVDLARFSPDAKPVADLDRLAGLSPPRRSLLRIGLVATYARWKGQDVFLRAAARLAGDPRLRFYVVGGSLYRTRDSQFSVAELQRMSVELGLGACIGFVPFQDDPAGVYRALDIVVHASTRPEPFGLVIAEAMACCRPLVATAAGGATELFDDGGEALGVPPGDDAALAQALTRLIESPDLRHRLSRAARQRAVQCFDPRRLARQVLEAYENVLDDKAD